MELTKLLEELKLSRLHLDHMMDVENLPGKIITAMLLRAAEVGELVANGDGTFSLPGEE